MPNGGHHYRGVYLSSYFLNRSVNASSASATRDISSFLDSWSMRFFSFLLIHSVHRMWILSNACLPRLRRSTTSLTLSSVDVNVGACVLVFVGISVFVSAGAFISVSVISCVGSSVCVSVCGSVDLNRGLTNLSFFDDTA